MEYSEEYIKTYLRPGGRHAIKLDHMDFDWHCQYGQPRALETAHWNEYYTDMLHSHPPRVPYAEGLVWQKSGV